MRRFLASLTLAMITALLAVSLASAQTPPQFQQGFRGMADLIPDVVGAPLENEHVDSATGNSTQRTTTGILVWRKADNVTAFTDGATTWLLGPEGLQSRPNSARFPWETADAPPSSLGQDAVTLKFTQSGNLWAGDGSIRNSLNVPIDAEVNAIGYDAPGGTPVIDVPSIFVRSIPPGATREISVKVHASSDVGFWAISVASSPVTSRADYSLDIDTTAPLEMDSDLAGAATELRKTESGLWLLRVSAEHGVVVSYGPTDPGVLGTFDPFTGHVVISSRLDSASAWVRAVVLAHELSHAHNAAAGVHVRTPLQCYREEAQAFQRQAMIWNGFWKGQLPSSLLSPYHEEMNDIAQTVLNDPETFVEQLVMRYRSECGPLAQSPTTILPPQ